MNGIANRYSVRIVKAPGASGAAVDRQKPERARGKGVSVEGNLGQIAAAVATVVAALVAFWQSKVAARAQRSLADAEQATKAAIAEKDHAAEREERAYARIEGQLEIQQKQIDRLVAQREEAEARYANVKGRLEAAENRLDEVEGANEKCEEHLARVLSELERAQEERGRLAVEVARLEGYLATAGFNRDGTRRQIVDMPSLAAGLLKATTLEESREAAGATAEPRPLGGVHVLIVEDDADSREVLAELLRLEGAEVDTAERCGEGLRLVAGFTFDVIISDIGLPGEDGYAFIEKVRVHEKARRLNRTPAIALTAYDREEDQARALRAGFDAHFGKPIQVGRLVSVLIGLTRRTPSGGGCD